MMLFGLVFRPVCTLDNDVASVPLLLFNLLVDNFSGVLLCVFMKCRHFPTFFCAGTKKKKICRCRRQGLSAEFRRHCRLSATCRRHVADKAKCRQFLSRQANFGDMVFSVSAHFCVAIFRH